MDSSKNSDPKLKNSKVDKDLKTKIELIKQAVIKDALDSAKTSQFKFRINNRNYKWSTNREKIAVIRKGLPFSSIEVLSKRTNIPVKHYLASLGIVQTTYNKKKRDNQLLTKQDSEFIVELVELYHFGISVFNDETEKFQRWLRKPNISLGAKTPESLFDSLTGIQEVKKSLNRLEYGNMA